MRKMHFDRLFDDKILLKTNSFGRLVGAPVCRVWLVEAVQEKPSISFILHYIIQMFFNSIFYFQLPKFKPNALPTEPPGPHLCASSYQLMWLACPATDGQIREIEESQ